MGRFIAFMLFNAIMAYNNKIVKKKKDRDAATAMMMEAVKLTEVSEEMELKAVKRQQVAAFVKTYVEFALGEGDADSEEVMSMRALAQFAEEAFWETDMAHSAVQLRIEALMERIDRISLGRSERN